MVVWLSAMSQIFHYDMKFLFSLRIAIKFLSRSDLCYTLCIKSFFNSWWPFTVVTSFCFLQFSEINKNIYTMRHQGNLKCLLPLMQIFCHSIRFMFCLWQKPITYSSKYYGQFLSFPKASKLNRFHRLGCSSLAQKRFIPNELLMNAGILMLRSIKCHSE